MAAWDHIGASLKFGSVTNTAITADLNQAEVIESQIRNAELQLAALRNQRDAVYFSLWDKLKRVYAGVKANYGDDSTEYEMVGRTRANKKKRRSRKTVAG
jgi:hypothetical protein